MSPDELRKYATTIILDHARDVEYLSIHEMSEQHLGFEISDDDAKAVDGLIAKATITVSFPDAPAGGAS